jgi:putative AbiEi antitoxin of type IV toxin-antitoxin system
MDRKALAAAITLARVQYGFITWRQALRAGLSPRAIARLVAEGHWRQVGNGLYQVNGVAPCWRGRFMSACLRGGEGALISHRSAAALWGIEGFGPPSTVDITVPPERRPRIPGVRVHRRTLTRTKVRDGIPVTPIPETILDLCALRAERSIPLRALDDVRRRKLVSTFELERCRDEHSGRGQAGSVLYRELLERRLGKTPPGTVFAAEVLDLLVAAGLPEPEAEVPVVIRGRRYWIDLAYRRPKIAIECLGKIGHLNEKAFEDDPVRSNDFALDGWLQLLVTYRRREESPESIVAEVGAALAVRGAP